MRRALLSVFAGAILAAPAAALEVPYLSGRVNDDARLLDARTAKDLDRKLKDYESRTGRQLVVLTIPSLEGAPLEEFSLKVARTWKLGRKGVDDGILLLVARDDHKVRIEVGYGLEGALTDAQCGRIIRDAIVPRFRGGDFSRGVVAGVDEMLAQLSGTIASPPPPGSVPQNRRASKDPNGMFALLIFLCILIQLSIRVAFSREPGMALIHFLGVNSFLGFYAAANWSDLIGGLLFIANTAFVAWLGWAASNTDWGRRMTKEAAQKNSGLYWISSMGSGGGSSGGFSGGGGSFGGGGASGSW
jgi:uncharacterized protein